MELTIKDALLKGVEAHKAGKLQEADRFYTAILKVQPKHPDANHNMGLIAVSVGKIEESLPFFKTALEANSTINQFWLSYFDALISLDRIADARTVFDQAKDKGIEGEVLKQLKNKLNGNQQDPPQDQLQSLIDLYSQGQLQEALETVQQLFQNFPRSAKLYNILGAVHLSLKQFDLAIESYKQVLKIKPDYIEVYYNMGNVLKDKGDLEAALDNFEQVVRMNPKHALAHFNMGNIYFTLGNLTKSTENYQQAIKIRPDFAEAYNNLGKTLMNRGEFNQAIIKFKKAIKYNPYYADAYFNIGNVLQDQGFKLKEAIQNYKQAIKIKPDYAEAFVNISILQISIGDLDAAIKNNDKALKINPKLAIAHNNKGIALIGKGELDASILNFKEALTINPDLTDAYFNLGNVLKTIRFNKPYSELIPLLQKLIQTGNYVRPTDISEAILSLLKQEDHIKYVIKETTNVSNQTNFNKIIEHLSQSQLLLTLMKICPIPDLDFEKLFIKIRNNILNTLYNLNKKSFLNDFLSALAQQCLINEFIYFETAEETKSILKLEQNLKTKLENSKQPQVVEILCFAVYRPIHKFNWISKFVFPPELSEVEDRLIKEPLSEKNIRKKLTETKTIKDKTSILVKKQY